MKKRQSRNRRPNITCIYTAARACSPRYFSWNLRIFGLFLPFIYLKTLIKVFVFTKSSLFQYQATYLSLNFKKISSRAQPTCNESAGLCAFCLNFIYFWSKLNRIKMIRICICLYVAICVMHFAYMSGIYIYIYINPSIISSK